MKYKNNCKQSYLTPVVLAVLAPCRPVRPGSGFQVLKPILSPENMQFSSGDEEGRCRVRLDVILLVIYLSLGLG